MRRGAIGTVAAGGYAGEPRRALIVQSDDFPGTNSVTICAFTSDETEAPLFRVAVAPSERNGLRVASRLMVHKITTVPRSRSGTRLGRLDDGDVLGFDKAAIIFLSLAGQRSGGA